MGITQVKPEIQDKLTPLINMRKDVFIKIKDRLTKMIWSEAVNRLNKFEISQVFDIPVKQAAQIDQVFNSKMKKNKQQPDQTKGIFEAHVPVLSESKISQGSSYAKPSLRIGPVANYPTKQMFNSIDSTELLMGLILCSDYLSSEEKWLECLTIINANIFDYLTYGEIRLVFKYAYSIIKHLTDLSISKCQLEEYIYDNLVFIGEEYYKQK